jgi:type II secretory ATPase GspE/PulE/Tfp pilus assembly ATPase PilB-like protein
MVGEIRDSDTAAIAINSSLTGHLVFSTLHTNSAAGSFPRLIDLGINPKIMNSAINITLAQRLLRRLCQHCKKEVDITSTEMIKEKKKIDSVLTSVVDRSEIPQNTTKMWIPGGCDKCGQIGYKGRIGIYEGILMTPEVTQVIEMSPSEEEVWKVAAPQAILNMTQDGIIKVLQGVTSLDELERVISIED